jgi:ParB family chromosome partitioning protein
VKLENGELTVGSARTLLALNNEEQIQSAAETITKGRLTVRDVEKLVRKLKKERSEAGRKSDGGVVVNYVEELEIRLAKALGRRVRIIEGKQKGRIEIEYYDRDDFERLYEMLSGLQSR